MAKPAPADWVNTRQTDVSAAIVVIRSCRTEGCINGSTECLPCNRTDSQATACTSRNTITDCKPGFKAVDGKCQCSDPLSYRVNLKDGESLAEYACLRS